MPEMLMRSFIDMLLSMMIPRNFTELERVKEQLRASMLSKHS